MGTGDYINIFMAVQPCNTANGYWGLHQYLHGCSALSHCKWVLGIASISSWLLSPVTLHMGTGDCINIFMATQPCHIAKGTGDCINILMATQPCNTANGYWRLHQYLCGYPAPSHCKWVLGIASISLWLLSPVTLQMGTGDCITIFMVVQLCNTANGYWGLHQYLYGYSALSHCKWVLGIASISSWLLSPVTLHMGTGDCINIFMATQPCHIAKGTGDCINILMATQPCNTANGYWRLHQYLCGYSAPSHCKWVLGIASISLWLLSPVTLQMGTGDCINIFMVVQLCNTANGYWGLHQYLYGYSALSHCKWELEIASISSWLLSPVTLPMGTGDYINIFMAVQLCNTANGYWGLHQYLHGCSAL